MAFPIILRLLLICITDCWAFFSRKKFSYRTFLCWKFYGGHFSFSTALSLQNSPICSYNRKFLKNRSQHFCENKFFCWSKWDGLNKKSRPLRFARNLQFTYSYFRQWMNRRLQKCDFDCRRWQMDNGKNVQIQGNGFYHYDNFHYDSELSFFWGLCILNRGLNLFYDSEL